MFEVFVFQCYGVDIYVNDDFCIVVGFEVECVVSVENFYYGIGGWGYYDVVGWFYCDFVVNGFVGEGFVWYLFEGYYVIGNW